MKTQDEMDYIPDWQVMKPLHFSHHCNEISNT